MISQNPRITIRDIARQAGVSAQTVSRVINNHPDVAAETRQRVAGIVDALGYHPSELARSLVQRRTATIGVVTAGLNQMGPSHTLNGITSKAEELGYAVLLKELPHYSVDDPQLILRFLFARQVDGILWAVPQVNGGRFALAQSLAEIPVPIIFLATDLQPGISAFSVDNYMGGVMATRHLLEVGRRHVAHISGPLDWWEARQRKQGWAATLTDAGRPVLPSHCSEGDWSAASGRAAFEQLLESYPRMDALFVANDQMAIAVLQMASQRGMRVPDDLAVVGFDNLAESAYLCPALTSISQDQQELGRRAIAELVRRVESARIGESVPIQQVLIAPRLIVRESTLGQAVITRHHRELQTDSIARGPDR